MKTIEAKVVVLGSQGVGKTSVVIRYVGGLYSKAASPTIGASFFTYNLNVDDYRVKLQVWDTAGQERFRSMAPMYYRKANAAMLVYDITSLDTYIDIKTWVSELRKNVDAPFVTCLVGNKCDLQDGRHVKFEDACEYAESIDALFYETSALKNTGIEEVFLELAKRLIKLYETSPTHGLQLCGTTDSPASNDDCIQIEPPSRHKGPPPSYLNESRCSC